MTSNVNNIQLSLYLRLLSISTFGKYLSLNYYLSLYVFCFQWYFYWRDFISALVLLSVILLLVWLYQCPGFAFNDTFTDVTLSVSWFCFQ